MFNNKIFVFVCDVVMFVLWALIFFCAMLAYNDGNFRTVFLIITSSSLAVYFALIHKPISKLMNTLSKKIKSIFTNVSKQLKKGEKSSKKVLHLHK